MRLTNPKGNILIIVLFVMIVSSLLGLLASQYVTTLSTLTWSFKNYYTAYYYAYGGIELSLAQLQAHGYGFEESHVLSYTGTCKWGGCGAVTTIQARAATVGNEHGQASCTGDQLMALQQWWSLIIPLFRDQSSGFDEENYHIMSVQELMQQTPLVHTQGVAWETYTVRLIDENVSFYAAVVQGSVGNVLSLAEQEELRVSQDMQDNKKYLIISNPASSEMSVCVSLETPTIRLPLPTVIVNSKGSYGTTQVALWASKVVQLPSYLVFGTISQ